MRQTTAEQGMAYWAGFPFADRKSSSKDDECLAAAIGLAVCRNGERLFFRHLKE